MASYMTEKNGMPGCMVSEQALGALKSVTSPASGGGVSGSAGDALH
jgi:hypothetical protein